MGDREGQDGARFGGDADADAYFDLQEVLGWAVDFFEALLAGVRHGLHLGGVEWWGGGSLRWLLRVACAATVPIEPANIGEDSRRSQSSRISG